MSKQTESNTLSKELTKDREDDRILVASRNGRWFVAKIKEVKIIFYTGTNHKIIEHNERQCGNALHRYFSQKGEKLHKRIEIISRKS